MRVYEIQGGFGLDHLKLTERPDPEPGAGQVRVRVRAVSLNRRDLMMVEGQYNPRQPLPLVPCSDGVGEVVAVGPGVEHVEVGDRVCGLFCQRWEAGAPDREALRTTLGGPLDGMLAEEVVLPERGVAKVPAYLTDEEAATLPCAALTAWSALVTQSETKPGDVVLTLGTGGVSLFAVQIARLLGARVILTSSSHDKLARAKELGAEAGIHYGEEPEWGRAARALAGGEGVDHVLELGGAGTFEQSLKAVRLGGHISVIGALAGNKQPISLTPVLMGNLRVQGVFVGHRQGFIAMCRAFEAAKLRPVVDEVVPFSEARAAFERMKREQHFGKICIRVAER